MPSVFHKLKTGNPEDQVPQLGLIPKDDIVHGHCYYDSKSLYLSLDGHVSTPMGLFLQMLSKDMVSAVGGGRMYPSQVVWVWRMIWMDLVMRLLRCWLPERPEL